MGRHRKHKDDPTWGRSRPKKKQKMCSRASVRFLRSLVVQKRLADKKREKTVCVTRTVELPSTRNVGDESCKLLFMIALGLLPKTTKGVTNQLQTPQILIEKLDPIIEAEAQLRTTERIFELFQRRKVESIQQRITNYHISVLSPVSADDVVETVDLVSDDDDLICIDEEEDDSDESNDEPVLIEENYRPRAASSSMSSYQHQPRRDSTPTPTGWYPEPPYRIIACSKPRQPVFKPIVNNQNSDSGIFRNWKPESMSKLININPPYKDNSKDIKSPSCSQTKLLNSLKSIPSNPSLGLSIIPSSKTPSGNTNKSRVSAHDERSSSVALGSETVITID